MVETAAAAAAASTSSSDTARMPRARLAPPPPLHALASSHRIKRAAFDRNADAGIPLDRFSSDRNKLLLYLR